MAHLRICLDTGNEAIVGRLIELLVAPVHLPAAVVRKHMAVVLLPMVPYMNDILSHRSESTVAIPNLDIFYRRAAQLCMSYISKKPSYIHTLMEIALSQGGVNLLKATYVWVLLSTGLSLFYIALSCPTRITPDVISKTDYVSLIDLALAVSRARDGLATTPDDLRVLSKIVSDLLSAAIATTNYYIRAETKKAAIEVPPARPSHLATIKVVETSAPTPQLALLHVQACLETGNNYLAERVIGNLADTPNLSTRDAELHTSTLLLPMIPLLEDLFKKWPGSSSSTPGMDKLCRLAVQVSLCQRRKEAESKLSLLLDIARTRGGATFLKDAYVPSLSFMIADQLC